MAVRNLIEQHVIFISNVEQFDENAIMANSLVQSLAVNSDGQDLVTGYQVFRHWDGTNWTNHCFFQIQCFVTAAFQTTIQQNISALQSAFPQYTIVTWGYNVAFGN